MTNIEQEFFKTFLVGYRYDKNNHRKDQFAYICPHCGEWTCTYVNNRVGNWLYYCHKCGEATNILDTTLTMAEQSLFREEGE